MRIVRAVFYDLLAPLHRDGAEYLTRFEDCEKTYPDEKHGTNIKIDRRLEQLIVSHREEMHGLRHGELKANGVDWLKLPPIPERSLSIPLSPGILGAWAPNGYGKTFALLLLQMMMQCRLKDDDEHWLIRFCKDSFDLASGQNTTHNNDFFNNISAIAGVGWKRSNLQLDSTLDMINRGEGRLQGVIPFRRLVFQFQDDDGEFSKLIISPAWEIDGGRMDVVDVLIEDAVDDTTTSDNDEDVRLPVWCGEYAIANGLSVNNDIELINLGNIKILESAAFLYAEIPKMASNESFSALADISVRMLMRSEIWADENNVLHTTKDNIDAARQARETGIDIYHPGIKWIQSNEKRVIRANYLNDLIYGDGDLKTMFSGEVSGPIPMSKDIRFNHIISIIESLEGIENSISATTMRHGDESDGIVIEDPWGIEVEFGVDPDGDFEGNDVVFKSSAGYLPWYVLSFGQRTEIITKLVAQMHKFLPLDKVSQVCTFIDEPEAGRSEFWIDLLGKYFQEMALAEDVDKQRSLVIVSHRDRVLNQSNLDGRHHLMQPLDS